MTREHKFRAWDVEAEVWRYFTLGDAIVGKMVRFAHCIQNISEFTGVRGQNGEEIYEGDIIMTDDIPSEDFKNPDVVTFEHGMWCGTGLMCEPEVIGTIYQNPELLK